MSYRCSSPKRKGRPRTNLSIVLDLDSTLVYTFGNPMTMTNLRIYKDPKMLPVRKRSYHFNVWDSGSPGQATARGTGELLEVAGVFRPHAAEFVRFCFDYFDTVCVWSAGQPAYVNAITDRLFSHSNPDNIFTWDNATQIPPDESDPEQRWGAEKPLARLFSSMPTMNEKNTFLLDDNIDYFEKVNPDNAIHIPAYFPAETAEELLADDDTLLRLMDWLQTPEVMYTNDVRELDKSRMAVFGLPNYIKEGPLIEMPLEEQAERYLPKVEPEINKEECGCKA